MEIPATIEVKEKELLAYYNNPKLKADILEEVEDYVGVERPFTKVDIPQIVSYHLLGECEFVYVEIA